MFLLQRQVPSDSSSLSYLFGCGGKGKAIAVDVHQGDIAWFITQAELKNVSIDFVIDTHIHADHISGGRELAKKCGVEYALHSSADVEFPFYVLNDNDVLVIGNVSVKIMHTPGHTDDSICLLVSDNRRSSKPWFIITGHTLFVGSTGRPDLHGQDAIMARKLYNSLFNKILCLPEYIEIYPGAQAGSVCGVGLSAKPVSTIAFEKRFNPALSADKETFIDIILADIPKQPLGMKNIIKQNISA